MPVTRSSIVRICIRRSPSCSETRCDALRSPCAKTTVSGSFRLSSEWTSAHNATGFQSLYG